ncbi:EAL domain-containing protein [Salmonella enterica subsp. enterica]|nr:EAL domain-containing protein [Salmonella enterica subsp. enterica serovar Veneziana]
MMNRYTTYSRVLNFLEKVVRHQKDKIISIQIEKMIREVDFHPFLQPIFNAYGDKLRGCEVLLRVKNNEEFTSPASYIQYLESSEHMNKITKRMLRDVSEFFSTKTNNLPKDFYFSFNIFASQLNSKDIVQEIITFCEKFKGKAGLVLEIVERGILQLDEEK